MDAGIMCSPLYFRRPCTYLQRRGDAINWNLNLWSGTRQVLGQLTNERPAIIRQLFGAGLLYWPTCHNPIDMPVTKLINCSPWCYSGREHT